MRMQSFAYYSKFRHFRKTGSIAECCNLPFRNLVRNLQFLLELRLLVLLQGQNVQSVDQSRALPGVH